MKAISHLPNNSQHLAMQRACPNGVPGIIFHQVSCLNVLKFCFRESESISVLPDSAESREEGFRFLKTSSVTISPQTAPLRGPNFLVLNISIERLPQTISLVLDMEGENKFEQVGLGFDTI